MRKNGADTPARPWEQQANENRKAFAAFRLWLETEPVTDRSYLKTFRQFRSKFSAKQCDGTFNGWVKKFHWEARARQYDNDRIRREHEAEMRVREADRIKWTKRRQSVAEEGWTTAEKLIEKAKEILAAPTFEREITREVESPDGRTIIQEITLQPVRFSLRDAAYMIEVANKLQRLSAEMATSIVETITPESRAAARLRQAREALREHRELFPEVAEQQRLEIAASAFGVTAEELTEAGEWPEEIG